VRFLFLLLSTLIFYKVSISPTKRSGIFAAIGNNSGNCCKLFVNDTPYAELTAIKKYVIPITVIVYVPKTVYAISGMQNIIIYCICVYMYLGLNMFNIFVNYLIITTYV